MIRLLLPALLLVAPPAAHAQHANRLANEVGSLLPYLRALRAAGEAGADWTSLDHATVQQSGFDLLNEVMAGKAPQCCICVQPAVHPCIARCMHLACTRCMVTWYHAAPLHGGGASSAYGSSAIFVERSAVRLSTLSSC